MKKKPSKNKSVAPYESVMRVHTLVFSLTFFIPLLCWLMKLLKTKQCFSLVGVGLFILSGHTIAFFNSYLEYLQKKDTSQMFDEAGLKRFLKVGIFIDLSLAFFFYSLGMK